MLQSSLVAIFVINCLIKEPQNVDFSCTFSVALRSFHPQRVGKLVFPFVVTKTFINDFEVSNVKISLRSFNIVFHHIWSIISGVMIVSSSCNSTNNFSIVRWFCAIYVIYKIMLMFKTRLPVTFGLNMYKNAVINIGLVRLSPWEWSKVVRGTVK